MVNPVSQEEMEEPTYLIADVANTCPLDPTQRTTIEATTTIRSVGGAGVHYFWHQESREGAPPPTPEGCATKSRWDPITKGTEII